MGLLEFNKLPINTLVGADWKTGVAELRLCIMFSPATSISATTRHTRLYFRIL